MLCCALSHCSVYLLVFAAKPFHRPANKVNAIHKYRALGGMLVFLWLYL